MSKIAFRSKPNTIPVDEQNCSPSQRNGVRLPNGIAFAFDRIPHFLKTLRGEAA